MPPLVANKTPPSTGLIPAHHLPSVPALQSTTARSSNPPTVVNGASAIRKDNELGCSNISSALSGDALRGEEKINIRGHVNEGKDYSFDTTDDRARPINGEISTHASGVASRSVHQDKVESKIADDLRSVATNKLQESAVLHAKAHQWWSYSYPCTMKRKVKVEYAVPEHLEFAITARAADRLRLAFAFYDADG